MPKQKHVNAKKYSAKDARGAATNVEDHTRENRRRGQQQELHPLEIMTTEIQTKQEYEYYCNMEMKKRNTSKPTQYFREQEPTLPTPRRNGKTPRTTNEQDNTKETSHQQDQTEEAHDETNNSKSTEPGREKESNQLTQEPSQKRRYRHQQEEEVGVCVCVCVWGGGPMSELHSECFTVQVCFGSSRFY